MHWVVCMEFPYMMVRYICSQVLQLHLVCMSVCAFPDSSKLTTVGLTHIKRLRLKTLALNKLQLQDADQEDAWRWWRDLPLNYPLLTLLISGEPRCHEYYTVDVSTT